MTSGHHPVQPLFSKRGQIEQGGNYRTSLCSSFQSLNTLPVKLFFSGCLNGIFCMPGHAHCFSDCYWAPWGRIWDRDCWVQTQSHSNQGHRALLSLALPLAQKADPRECLSWLWYHFFLFFLVLVGTCGFSSFLCGDAKIQTEGLARFLRSLFTLFLFFMHKLCSFSYSSFPMSIKSGDGIKIIWLLNFFFHTVYLMYSIIDFLFLMVAACVQEESEPKWIHRMDTCCYSRLENFCSKSL